MGGPEAGRWQVRRGEARVRVLEESTAFHPHELPSGCVEVLDTRARDLARFTHDSFSRSVEDVVRVFVVGYVDQPIKDGVDNVQNARAVTSAARWWHVSRFNWTWIVFSQN